MNNKREALHIQEWTDPECFKRWRLHEFLDSRRVKVTRYQPYSLQSLSNMCLECSDIAACSERDVVLSSAHTFKIIFLLILIYDLNMNFKTLAPNDA